MKLLFARIGKTYSPISKNQVKKDTVADVIKHVKTYEIGSKLLLLAPVYLDKKRDLKTLLNIFSQQGYARIKMSDSVLRIEDFPFDSYNNETLQLVVDRIILKEDEDFYNRLADAIQTAFFEGKGTCTIENLNTNKTVEFSNKFEFRRNFIFRTQYAFV